MECSGSPEGDCESFLDEGALRQLELVWTGGGVEKMKYRICEWKGTGTMNRKGNPPEQTWVGG